MKYKAIKEIALKTALGYLEKDPEKNMPKLMNWVDKLAGTGPDSFESQRAAVRADQVDARHAQPQHLGGPDGDLAFGPAGLDAHRAAAAVQVGAEIADRCLPPHRRDHPLADHEQPQHAI